MTQHTATDTLTTEARTPVAFELQHHSADGEIVCPPCKDEACKPSMRGVAQQEGEPVYELYDGAECYFCGKALPLAAPPADAARR